MCTFCIVSSCSALIVLIDSLHGVDAVVDLSIRLILLHILYFLLKAAQIVIAKTPMEKDKWNGRCHPHHTHSQFFLSPFIAFTWPHHSGTHNILLYGFKWLGLLEYQPPIFSKWIVSFDTRRYELRDSNSALFRGKRENGAKCLEVDSKTSYLSSFRIG